MENNQVLEDTKQYIIVKFNKEQYGINIKYIQNIVVLQRITRIPKAPSFIKGVINLRGEIIPVMSLRLKFGLELKEYTNKTRIIIIKLEQNTMGLIVDEVKEVIQISDSSIEKVVYDAKDEKSYYISGIGKLDGSLVTILNLNGIINEKKNNNETEKLPI